MDILEAIEQRYSVRSYRNEQVEPDKLNKVLEAARMAPSASNRQEWRFVIVTEEAKRTALQEAANNQAFVSQAPVTIACCAQSDGHIMKCGHPCAIIDVAIAIDHMTLAAVALGLGTCWIGAFDQQKVKEILDIPAEIAVIELLTLGYPADSLRKKRRLPIEELVHYEAWGEIIV